MYGTLWIGIQKKLLFEEFVYILDTPNSFLEYTRRKKNNNCTDENIVNIIGGAKVLNYVDQTHIEYRWYKCFYEKWRSILQYYDILLYIIYKIIHK